MKLLWPWVWLLLPLPVLLRFWLAPAKDAGAALRVPFFSTLGKLKGAKAPLGGLNPWALGVWLLLLAAASDPIIPSNPKGLPQTGRDIMLVVDISGSMRNIDFLIEKEPVDRLKMLKIMGGDFIKARQGDRLGLIVFGTKPYLRAGLSHDLKLINDLLQETEIALAGEETALGDAIGLALKRMRDLPGNSKAIVVLTDGVSNAGLVGPLQAASLAREMGIRIHSIGIGTEDTAAPNPYGTWSAQGAREFNREILSKIAETTEGSYAQALDSKAMQDCLDNINKLEPAQGVIIKDIFAYRLYPWLLGLAMAIASWLLWRRIR